MNYKISLCPGSANIVNNLDDLVERCNQKISKVRAYANPGSRNSIISKKSYNTIIPVQQDFNDSAMKFKNMNIKKPMSSKKRKIKSKLTDIV